MSPTHNHSPLDLGVIYARQNQTKAVSFTRMTFKPFPLKRQVSVVSVRFVSFLLFPFVNLLRSTPGC